MSTSEVIGASRPSRHSAPIHPAASSRGGNRNATAIVHPFVSAATRTSFSVHSDTKVNFTAGDGGLEFAILGAELAEHVFNQRNLGLLDRYLQDLSSEIASQRNAAATVMYYFCCNTVAIVGSISTSAWISDRDVRYQAASGAVGLGSVLGSVMEGLREIFPRLSPRATAVMEMPKKGRAPK